jgi:hypothetical protein
MNAPTMLDRLIRVREVRARLALVALGRLESRRRAEAELDSRVQALLAGSGSRPGRVHAGAANARAGAGAMLGELKLRMVVQIAPDGGEPRVVGLQPVVMHGKLRRLRA